MKDIMTAPFVKEMCKTRGKFCDYKADLKKSVIEPLVIEAVKEIVSEKYFAQAIKDRIGSISKNDDIDKEIKNFENRLNEIELNKYTTGGTKCQKYLGLNLQNKFCKEKSGSLSR